MEESINHPRFDCLFGQNAEGAVSKVETFGQPLCNSDLS